MKRISVQPRIDYVKKLEELSFEFHTMDEIYWDESAYYEFTSKQIDQLDDETNELYGMCLEAVQYVIDNDLYDLLKIDRRLVPIILRSWNEREPSVYGRFDFVYDGIHPPKMLEFNADTPTALYEASVVQWNWLQDFDKNSDQFNSIHEKLIAYWKSLDEDLDGEIIHFTCIDTIEDFTTTEYLRDTADQGGLATDSLLIDDIGWDNDNNEFVDADGKTIINIFKLYPWEWLINEDFGENILKDKNKTRWIEPAWKLILSNKGILPILWKLFPFHKNLLPAYFDNPHGLLNYVKKPIYSREGANITIYKLGVESTSVDGDYGEEGYIYQDLCELPNYNGNYPVIGSWIIGGKSAGIGIRESKTEITDNLSRFVPHLFN